MGDATDKLEAGFRSLEPDDISVDVRDAPGLRWVLDVAAAALRDVRFGAGFTFSEPYDLYLYILIGDATKEVAQTSLIDLVAEAIEDRNQIGDAEEIAVLERLKAVVDAAIEARKTKPD
jgi:hypothetical protein